MTTADAALPLLTRLVESRTPEVAEASLLGRARAGEREAFGELILPHLPTARRVALAAVGRHAEADEAVQEASLAAWQHLGSLANEAAFRAWFLRIVWRKALDRRRSVRAWLSRMATDVDHRTLAHEMRSVDPGPEDLARVSELQRTAAQLIKALPRRLRDPFLLAASGDHRYDDIAELLGIPVGSVKWRVSEARRLIRAKLDRLGHGGGR